MSPLDYLGILFSLFCSGLLGLTITRHSISSSILAGLSIVGATLSVTAWFVPLYTKYIVFLLFSLGLINLRSISFPIHVSLRRTITVLITVGFFLYIFRHFSYTNYFYNNHDPAYWGYTFELLRADYFGPTRVPTFYPENFAPTHIISQTVLVSLLSFSKHLTLATIIEAKYLLISITFGFLGEKVITRSNNVSFLIIGALLSFFIFELELGYNLLISSYFYTIILLQIVILALSKEPNELELIFFSLILMIARGPIFYMAFALVLYYLYSFSSLRFNKKVITTLLVVFCVMLTWAYFPGALERTCQDISFNIMNPLDLKQLLTIVGIRQWVLPDPIVSMLLQYTEDIDFFERQRDLYSDKTINALVSVIPFIFYILVKYYVPIMLSLRVLSERASHIQRIKLKGLVIFTFVSLWGWLFIRNGVQIAHQTHSYLLISMLTLILVVISTVRRPSRLVAFLPFCLLFIWERGLNDIPFSRTFMEGISKNHIKFDATKHKFNSEPFYVPKENQEMWKSEIEALLQGSRVSRADYGPAVLEREFSGDDQVMTSIMPMWIVLGKSEGECYERIENNS